MEGRTTRSGYLSSTIEGSHLSQGEPGQWAETANVLPGSFWSGRVAVPLLQHNGSPTTIGLSNRPTLPQSVRRLPDRISRASSCSLAETMAAISRTRNWLFQPSLPEILARIPALLQAYAHCSSGQGLEPRVALLTVGGCRSSANWVRRALSCRTTPQFGSSSCTRFTHPLGVFPATPKRPILCELNTAKRMTD